jgi:hypothetical protein
MRLQQLFAIAALAAVASCSNAPVDPASANLTGTVEFRSEPGAARRIDVRSDNFDGDANDYVVSVRGPVFRQETDGTFTLSSFEQIPLGARVRVWHSGTNLRILPASLTAQRVIYEPVVFVLTH